MKRRNERSVLLVDLDGTLTDPAEGIVGSFRFALEALGRSPPPAAELTWIIGPPLRRSFAEMLGATGDSGEALSIYRGRYSTEGLFEALVYDGVRNTLADLRAAGARLFLCTAKPAVYAERILRHFDLRRYFEGVYGADQFPALGLPADAWSGSGVEFRGAVNLLKGAIVAADMITAVSPTYADEIRTREGGWGLDLSLIHI